MSSQPELENSFNALLWMLGPLAAVMVAALIAFPLSLGAPRHAASEFYSAAADVGVVLLVALAIEARLFRLRGIPRVTLVKPTKLLTNDRARKAWTTLYVVQVLITAGVMVWIERLILLTLARGDYGRASAPVVFGGLVFGLVAVMVTGLMLPAEPD